MEDEYEALPEEVTASSMSTWLKDPITQFYMGRLEAMCEDSNEQMMAALRISKTLEASRFLASYDAIKDLLKEPFEIIDQLRLEAQGQRERETKGAA